MTGKIIAIGNLKGGTGKTTIAVNLCGALANGAGHPVALVDADRQASASAWLAQAGDDGLSCHVLPLDTTGNAQRWLKKVRDLAEKNDYVLIDLPADIGPATQAAIAGADLVIVPVTPSPLDFHAAAQVIKLLRGVREARTNGHPACLLVGSKVDRRTAVGRGIEIALKEFKEPVGPSVCQRTAFVSAAVRGRWVGAYAAEGAAREEITALANRVRRAARSRQAA